MIYYCALIVLISKRASMGGHRKKRVKIIFIVSLNSSDLRGIRGAEFAQRFRADYLPSLVEKILILLIGTRLTGNEKANIFLSYFLSVRIGTAFKVDVRTNEFNATRSFESMKIARTWRDVVESAWRY